MDELRKRGGPKHYSSLTVKLGIAEAEIRSLTARKMELAVKLTHVERERDEALQVTHSGRVASVLATAKRINPITTYRVTSVCPDTLSVCSAHHCMQLASAVLLLGA